MDEEKARMRGALASSIVSEKPNVKWDDVAGLDAAKDALKEAVILPVRFKVRAANPCPSSDMQTPCVAVHACTTRCPFT